jgi:hypothetical protein
VSFGYKRSATIDHTKCAAGALSGFPVAISITLDKTHVRSDGYDIYLYSDSGLTTRIPAERESYDSSTGIWIGWIKVDLPASSGSDLVIWFAYGDAAQSTDPNTVATYGKTSVWDSNYKLVMHGGDGTTLSVADSTSNGVNGTNYSTTAVTGKVGGALSLNGTSQYVDFGSSVAMPNSERYSLGCWVYPKTITGYAIIVSRYSIADNWELSDYTNHVYLGKNGSVGLYINSPTLALNTWHHVYFTTDSSGNRTGYVNGSQAGYTAGLWWEKAVGSLLVGKRNDGAFGAEMYFDEMQISDNTRSADWIAAEYSNQSDITIGSGKFWSAAGSETAIGGGGASIIPLLMVIYRRRHN